MKTTILSGILVVAAGCGALMAQAGGQAQAQPAGPKVKSNEEAKAVNALITAQQSGPDAIIKAADDLLTRFADTEFKEVALNMEANAYQQKGDFARTEVIDEDILKGNPKNYRASLQLAEMIVNHTGENDLDKDDKLAKVNKLLNQSIEDIKAAPKPAGAPITDEQWATFKKQLTGEAQADLGKSAVLAKKYDEGITLYKTAYETDPQTAYEAYLAQAYQKAGHNDEALAICTKLLSDPQLNPSIKQYTLMVQKVATAAKSAPK